MRRHQRRMLPTPDSAVSLRMPIFTHPRLWITSYTPYRGGLARFHVRRVMHPNLVEARDTGYPFSFRTRARFRQLFASHSSGRSGSLRVSGSIHSCRAESGPGCRAMFGWRPPLGRRTRPGSGNGVSFSPSCRNRLIVERATPVGFATCAIPPRPKARASAAASKRRARFSECGDRAPNRYRTLPVRRESESFIRYL